MRDLRYVCGGIKDVYSSRANINYTNSLQVRGLHDIVQVSNLNYNGAPILSTN